MTLDSDSKILKLSDNITEQSVQLNMAVFQLELLTIHVL